MTYNIQHASIHAAFVRMFHLWDVHLWDVRLWGVHALFMLFRAPFTWYALVWKAHTHAHTHRHTHTHTHTGSRHRPSHWIPSIWGSRIEVLWRAARCTGLCGCIVLSDPGQLLYRSRYAVGFLWWPCVVVCCIDLSDPGQLLHQSRYAVKFPWLLCCFLLHGSLWLRWLFFSQIQANLFIEAGMQLDFNDCCVAFCCTGLCDCTFLQYSHSTICNVPRPLAQSSARFLEIMQSVMFASLHSNWTFSWTNYTTHNRQCT